MGYLANGIVLSKKGQWSAFNWEEDSRISTWGAGLPLLVVHVIFVTVFSYTVFVSPFIIVMLVAATENDVFRFRNFKTLDTLAGICKLN